MKAVAILMTVFSLAFGASTAMATEMQGNNTVVVRFNPKTKTAEKAVISQKITSKEEAQKAIANAKFVKISDDKTKTELTELDREQGASSWFWFAGGWGGYNYYRPAYYSYGYAYTPYYSYVYSGCNYYYYGGCGYGCGGLYY